MATIICEHCGIQTTRYRSPAEMKRVKHKLFFCSRKCRAQYVSKKADAYTKLICPVCKKSFLSLKSKNGLFCSRECHADFRRKGYINSRGYIEVTIQGKSKLHHRLIMEQHIGRKLTEFEHVHHIDGNKLNNEICNLEILNASKHSHIHHQLSWDVRYVCQLFQEGKRLKEVARIVGVNHNAIRSALKYRNIPIPYLDTPS